MANTVVAAKSLDELCVDTIRTLSMDAVQQANSGHPGTPMALAQRLLESLNSLADYLSRHPEALLRGKAPGKGDKK